MAQATFRAEPSINALVVEDDYDLAELIKQGAASIDYMTTA